MVFPTDRAFDMCVRTRRTHAAQYSSTTAVRVDNASCTPSRTTFLADFLDNGGGYKLSAMCPRLSKDLDEFTYSVVVVFAPLVLETIGSEIRTWYHRYLIFGTRYLVRILSVSRRAECY